MLRFWLLLAALFVAATVSISATGVVAFRTPERVVLGVDSALTHIDTLGRTMHVATGCKLSRAGAWTVAWGGLVAGGSTTDLAATFQRTIAPAPSLAALGRAVERFVARHVTTLRWADLPSYREPGKVVLWAAVGRVSRGTPELGIFRAIVAATQPAVRLHTDAAFCPGDCTSGRLSAGQSIAAGPISRLIAEPPAWLLPYDGRAARRLLSLQAQATPRVVAAPFNVLEITANGARWVDRDARSACALSLGE